MIRLNTMLTKRGFRRTTRVQSRQMWVRGTEAVVRHEAGSALYKMNGIQCLEFIDKDNNSTVVKYDDPDLKVKLLKFIEGGR